MNQHPLLGLCHYHATCNACSLSMQSDASSAAGCSNSSTDAVWLYRSCVDVMSSSRKCRSARQKDADGSGVQYTAYKACIALLHIAAHKNEHHSRICRFFGRTALRNTGGTGRQRCRWPIAACRSEDTFAGAAHAWVLALQWHRSWCAACNAWLGKVVSTALVFPSYSRPRTHTDRSIPTC